MEQFINWFGVLIHMENTASKDLKIMETHYKEVKEKYGVGNISFRRYKYIRSAMIPTIEEIEKICNLFADSSCR